MTHDMRIVVLLKVTIHDLGGFRTNEILIYELYACDKLIRVLHFPLNYINLNLGLRFRKKYVAMAFEQTCTMKKMKNSLFVTCITRVKFCVKHKCYNSILNITYKAFNSDHRQ